MAWNRLMAGQAMPNPNGDFTDRLPPAAPHADPSMVVQPNDLLNYATPNIYVGNLNQELTPEDMAGNMLRANAPAQTDPRYLQWLQLMLQRGAA